jgi:PBP1b-binding outer membrane lipoprotein LpoB
MKKIIMVAILALALIGCDRPRSRAEVKETDYTTGTIHHEGCEFIVYKEYDSHDSVYRTAGIVHNPNCKKCKSQR